VANNQKEYLITDASLYTVDAMHPGFVEYQFQMVEEIKPQSLENKLWKFCKPILDFVLYGMAVFIILGMIGGLLAGIFGH
jgi:hypothetical protein